VHVQFTHFISIYETINDPYDGEKRLFQEKKKKQHLKELLYPPLNRATA